MRCCLVALLALCFSHYIAADTPSSFYRLLPTESEPLTPSTEQKPSPKYLAQIEVHSTEELNNLLERSEELFDKGEIKPGQDTPVSFVLHGPEALLLLQSNYPSNQQLVDLAAKLSAFKVVDIRVCETWMGNNQLDQSQLPPFIGTGPFGPAETKRLLEQEAYVYF